jgi:hypothetical protein
VLITTQSVKDEPDTGMAKKEPPLDLDITQCKILPPPSIHLEDNHDMKDMLAKVSIPTNPAEREQSTKINKDLRSISKAINQACFEHPNEEHVDAIDSLDKAKDDLAAENDSDTSPATTLVDPNTAPHTPAILSQAKVQLHPPRTTRTKLEETRKTSEQLPIHPEPDSAQNSPLKPVCYNIGDKPHSLEAIINSVSDNIESTCEVPGEPPNSDTSMATSPSLHRERSKEPKDPSPENSAKEEIMKKNSPSRTQTTI